MSTVPVTVSLPPAIAAAARSLSGAQFKFLTAGAVWAHTVGLDAFEPSTMARAVADKFPSLNVKTIGNYLRSGLTLAKAHTAVLTANPDAAVYANWLSAEAKKLGYTLAEPDLMAMLAGKASAAKRKALDEETRRANADVAAAAAAAPKLGTSTDKPADPVEQPLVDAKAEPVRPADAVESAAVVESAAAPVVVEPVILQVVRKADGNLHVMIDGATAEELSDLSVRLQAEADRYAAEAAANVEAHADALDKVIHPHAA